MICVHLHGTSVLAVLDEMVFTPTAVALEFLAVLADRIALSAKASTAASAFSLTKGAGESVEIFWSGLEESHTVFATSFSSATSHTVFPVTAVVTAIVGLLEDKLLEFASVFPHRSSCETSPLSFGSSELEINCLSCLILVLDVFEAGIKVLSLSDI